MGHLKDMGMNYFMHMIRAFSFAFEMFVGVVVLLIHGVIPSVFCKEASNRVADIYYRMKSGDSESNRILVRFNTKYKEDDLRRNWRVLINGEETLAHDVYINVPTETIVEPIATGEIKYHFLCWGSARFSENHIAVIE